MFAHVPLKRKRCCAAKQGKDCRCGVLPSVKRRPRENVTIFTDISKFCTPHSVAWVLSCATHTARNMACCAATQRCNLRCFALFPRIFGTASLLNGVLPFLRPVSGRSAKHCNLQRCVAAQHAMLRACCVCVACDKTHASCK